MDSQPTKVVLRRGLAFLIDSIPGFALYWVLIMSMGEKLGEKSGTNLVMQTKVVNGDVRAQLGDSVYHLSGSDFTLVAIIALAYWIGLFVVIQGLSGVTIGKLLVGIRTVDAQGRPCGMGRAAVRWLLLIVDGFFYLFPIVGLVTALASEGNRRVGDMAASTYVVRARAAGQPVPVGTASATAPTPVPGAQPQWDPQLGAHVVWEPMQQIWLRWDPDAGQWVPRDADRMGS